MDSSGWAPERLKVFFEGDERRYSTTDSKSSCLCGRLQVFDTNFGCWWLDVETLTFEVDVVVSVSAELLNK